MLRKRETVSEQNPQEFFGIYCAIFHGRTGIDFNQPRVEVIVDHKVIAIHLERVFAVFDHVLDA